MKLSSDIDTGIYENGRVVTDEQLKEANLIRDEFHGDWNYIIGSRNKTNRDVIN